MTALQVFTQALEKATNSVFVSSVTYSPMHLPAYKEFHLTLREVSGEGRIYKMDYKGRATTKQEREQLTEQLTEDFIAYVLVELLKNKGYETV